MLGKKYEQKTTLYISSRDCCSKAQDQGNRS